MTAALWVRAEMRQRWRQLLALGLLAGIVGGVVVGSLAGAARTDSAYDRLLARSNATHLDVQLNAGLDGNMDEDLGGGLTARQVMDRLRADERVEAVGGLSFLHAGPADADIGAGFITIALLDDAVGRTVERARVVEGRLPAVDAPEEIAVNELAVKEMGLRPGRRLTFVSRTPEQLEKLAIEGDIDALNAEPGGPRMPVRVTGVVRLPGDVGSTDQGGPAAIVTPAFHERYGREIGQFGPAAIVRLRDGYAGVPGVTRLVEQLTAGSEDVAVDDNRTDVNSVHDAVRVQTIALLVFGLAALLAGLVAIGQAVLRQTATSADQMPALRAIGLTRRQRAAAMLAVLAPALAGATVLTLGLAFASTARLPFGLAGRAEPDPGLHFDLVLGLATLAWVALLVGLVGLAVWRTSQVATDADASGEFLRPTVASRLAAPLGNPSVLTGLRMAFERRRGPTAAPVRPALLGAGAAVAGVLAAVTFGASLNHLLATPALAGYPWHAEMAGGEEFESIEEPVDNAAKDSDVEALLVAHIVGDVPIGGERVQGFGVRPIKGDGGLTVLSGRMPQAADEVALGPETLRAVDRAVGQTVASRTADGEARRFTIVGTALFPVIDDSDYADGAVFTDEGLEGLDAPSGFYDGLLRYREGVDVTAKRAALEKDLGYLFDVTIPSAVTNLRQARGFPWAVAGFVGLLGVAAVVHALVLSGRRWRGDLAVLRSLGMFPRQLRAAVAVQATAIGVVGVIVGVPLGVAAGRWLWSAVASNLLVVDRPVVPLVVVALLVPAVLVVVNLLALVPGRRVARLAPATVLRSE